MRPDEKPDFADRIEQVMAGRLVVVPGYCFRCAAEFGPDEAGGFEWPERPHRSLRVCGGCRATRGS